MIPSQCVGETRRIPEIQTQNRSAAESCLDKAEDARPGSFNSQASTLKF
jgi:hypothetical protein